MDAEIVALLHLLSFNSLAPTKVRYILTDIKVQYHKLKQIAASITVPAPVVLYQLENINTDSYSLYTVINWENVSFFIASK